MRITIHLSGGLVDRVETDRPASEPIDALICDHDLDSENPVVYSAPSIINDATSVNLAFWQAEHQTR